MTRQQAADRALAMSKTGRAIASESMGHYINDAGEASRYESYAIHVDGVCIMNDHSYEEAFEEMEKVLPTERQKRIAELKAELAAAEGGER